VDTIFPFPHFIFTRKKKLVGRVVPNAPPFGVTENFTLPSTGATALTQFVK
jgi:hypothetical protein